MLDVNRTAPSAENQKAEAPRPKPNLEMPTIDPEVNYLGTISIFAAVFVIVAGIALYVLQGTISSELSTKDAEVKSLETDLGTEPLKSTYEEIIATQKGLDAFSDVLKNQTKWSAMFKEYEIIIPKNLKITALTMDEKMTVKLNGDAADYMGIAKFIQGLENSKIFSDVKLVSSSISESEESQAINFAISYSVDEKELAKLGEPESVTSPSSIPNNQFPSGTNVEGPSVNEPTSQNQ